MGRKARRAARTLWRALFPPIERPSSTTPASIAYYRTGGVR